MCVGSNPTPDIVLSNIKLVTSKVYAKYTTPAGIRIPDLWIRNPTRYPLRYKGCVSLLGHQDTNYAKWFLPSQPPKICHMSLVCMFQWRNRLARGTYNSSTSEKCRGCEFEPHLEQIILKMCLHLFYIFSMSCISSTNQLAE